MNPLAFTVLFTALAGLFLIVFGFYKYKWTRDLIWLIVIIIGFGFLYVSYHAAKQRRAFDDRRAAAELSIR